MNIVAIIFLAIAGIIGIVTFIGEASPKRVYSTAKSAYVSTGWQWREGFVVGSATLAIALAIVFACWGLVAFPISTYNHNTCKNEADGYGLDFDWSIRNDCRVYLPSGQLIPITDIRITSDGDIINDNKEN